MGRVADMLDRVWAIGFTPPERAAIFRLSDHLRNADLPPLTPDEKRDLSRARHRAARLGIVIPPARRPVPVRKTLAEIRDEAWAKSRACRASA
jgi:hypothetical protein